MRRFLLFALVGMLFSVRAQTPDADSSQSAPSGPKGIIILTSATGKDPVTIAFSTVAFASFDSGMVTDAGGAKTYFDDRDIGRIVYFDQDYYNLLHNDYNFQQYASALRPREVFVNIQFPRITTDQDAKEIQASKDALDYLVAHYPQSKDLLQPQIDALAADLSQYAQNQVFVNGKWISQDEFKRMAPPSTPGEYVTFTTKDGRTYEHAKVHVVGDDLSVLTDSGGATIPFSLLPDDLSGFPPAVQHQIQVRRAAVASEPTSPEAQTSPAPAATPATPAASAPPSSIFAEIWAWISTTFENIWAAVSKWWNSLFSSAPAAHPSNSASAPATNSAPSPPSPPTPSH